MSSKTAFSLIEIIISLALFSISITAIVSLSISMANTQKEIQSQLFLTQTAQTTLENISRNLRYGYSYSGTDFNTYNNRIVVNTLNIGTDRGASASSTQILTNAENSPFILFETQNGDPNKFSDQNAYCMQENKLYRITTFVQESPPNGSIWSAECNTGQSMLPENVTIESISFDIYGSDPGNPKNPTVRVKMRLKHEEAGSVNIQTSVTQRLVTYF